MPIPFEIDFKSPDYLRVYKWRTDKLAKIRQNPKSLPALFAYYRDNPIDFIEDWGMTYDPRNVGTEIPAAMPFILFPKQREFLQSVLDHWRDKKPLLVEKSRDVGISWLAVGLASSLCLFNRDLVIGFGSRKEEYVDKSGSPKALFYKARKFIMMLPAEFRQGWHENSNAPHMRLTFPFTGSAITGEAGDNIGRGDRTSIYFVDESAFLERPALVDAALSATTNCRVDMSSVNGMGNSFAERRHSGRVSVFTFDWRDDPRKDDAWYQKQCAELDPVTVAQEIDRNYNASVRNQVIPGAWVQAALDAHIKLGIKPTGERRGAFDVADEGKDSCAFAGGHGVVVDHIESWKGKGADIYDSVEHVFSICDERNYHAFRFDSDGLGAGVRGDARKINENRNLKGQKEIEVIAFRGSEAVQNPEQQAVEGRTNEDFFANSKSQGWWNLRVLFQNTYRAVVEGMPYDPDNIISISTQSPEYLTLVTELSQVQYDKNNAGKIIIEKQPEGTRSPNHADAVMILRAPMKIEPRGFFDL